MRDLQLVIFDCDGVLVDSEVISNEVLARSLTEQGLPTTLAQSRRDYQGLLLAEIDSQARAKLGRPLARDWLESYERDRAAVFRRELRAVPGVAETVRRIKTAGVAVCVASQGKLEKTRLSLKLTKLDHLFPDEALISAYSIPRGKPHPDLFLHVAQTMAVEPARCVVIEAPPPASPPRSRPRCASSATRPTATRRRCERPAPRSSGRWRRCRGCWGSADPEVRLRGQEVPRAY
jgi:HAD superfamily hydrolase (TIGR01509 family)